MSEGNESSSEQVELKVEAEEKVNLVQEAVNEVSHDNDVDRAVDLPSGDLKQEEEEEKTTEVPKPAVSNKEEVVLFFGYGNLNDEKDEFAELQQYVDTKPEDEQPPEENKEVIENLRNEMEAANEEPPEEYKEVIDALRIVNDNPAFSLDPNDYTNNDNVSQVPTTEESSQFSVDPSDYVAKHGIQEDVSVTVSVSVDPDDFIKASSLTNSNSLQNYFQQPPPCYSSFQPPPPSMNFGPMQPPSPYFSYAIPNFQSQLPPMFTPQQNPAAFMSQLPPQSPQALYSSAPNIAFFNSSLGVPQKGGSPLGKSGNYVSDFTKNAKRSKGLKLFSDVFSRADKNDDGALFFEEFQGYFQDSVLDDDQLLNLFNKIDTSNTGMISLSEMDEFFQHGFDKFQFIFDSLAELNKVVNNCLRIIAADYPKQSFHDQFRTRFFIKEFINQLTSINSQMVEARNSFENPIRFDNHHHSNNNNNNGDGNGNTANLIDERTEDLRREVDRLSGLIDKLYDKRVQLEWDNKAIDFEEPEDYVILCRTFHIMPQQLENFDNSITKYYHSSSSEKGQLKFSIRRMPNQEIYRIIQIFENQNFYNQHKRSTLNRNFLKEVIDYLEDPVENDFVSIPKSWWKRNL